MAAVRFSTEEVIDQVAWGDSDKEMDSDHDDFVGDIEDEEGHVLTLPRRMRNISAHERVPMLLTDREVNSVSLFIDFFCFCQSKVDFCS